MRHRRWISILLVLSVFFFATPLVMADDPIHKAGRGVVNVLTGWIEIPKQLHLGSREDNPVTGVAMGIGKGVSLTVLRMAVGAYEAVTFALPYPRGYISPYEEMQLPDYAWE